MYHVSPASQLLSWPQCRNVRELGGLATSGGRQIRPGALVRSDALTRLDAEGIQQVRAYGVSRILDLRASWELRNGSQHPFCDDSIYRRAPFIDESRDHERDPAEEHTLADLYRGSINRNGRTIAAAVTAIAEAPPGPVVLHCLSGADRAGMLVALVLDTLAVKRDLIADDYARSHDAYAEIHEPASHVQDRAQCRTSILDTLDHVDQRHGGATRYLSEHGTADSTLDRLRKRLLDTKPQPL